MAAPTIEQLKSTTWVKQHPGAQADTTEPCWQDMTAGVRWSKAAAPAAAAKSYGQYKSDPKPIGSDRQKYLQAMVRYIKGGHHSGGKAAYQQPGKKEGSVIWNTAKINQEVKNSLRAAEQTDQRLVAKVVTGANGKQLNTPENLAKAQLSRQKKTLARKSACASRVASTKASHAKRSAASKRTASKRTPAERSASAKKGAATRKANTEAKKLAAANVVIVQP
jgi:type IV secretory pathway VirB10-like protein